MRRVITEEWCTKRLKDICGDRVFNYYDLVKTYCPSEVNLTNSHKCNLHTKCKCEECWLQARGSLKEED